MSSKASTTPDLIRQRSPLTLAAVCGAIGLVLLVSLAWQWADNPQPLFAAWVVLSLAFTWVLFVRPAVLLDEDGVTIRNVVRDIHIPWVMVTDVESRWSLKVFAGDQGYTAWAISAQGRPKVAAGGLLGIMPRKPNTAANSHSHPSTASPKITASTVARSIEQAQGEYSEALARASVTSPADAQVRVTWVPMALAIVLLPALAVVALSLT
ncbi:MAG: PH domain-containing protein [Actinomycetota bacterium]